MNGVGAIVRKELRSGFNSAIAYVVVVFFLVFTSVSFFYLGDFVGRDIATLREYFGIMPIVLVILLPAMTMRSWAEEHKLGTVEVLSTLPVTEWSLVLGKYLATIVIFLLTILLTVLVPLSVLRLGNFDGGVILGQYLGIVLLGSAGIAIGLFVSSVTRNQISAFLISAVILVTLTLSNEVNRVVALPRAVAAVINYTSFQFHFRSFAKGVLDTRDIAFFVVVTVLFLGLNRWTLLSRKWR